MFIYAGIKSKIHIQIHAELTGRYLFNALSLDQIFKHNVYVFSEIDIFLLSFSPRNVHTGINDKLILRCHIISLIQS